MMKTRTRYLLYSSVFTVLSIPFTIVGVKVINDTFRNPPPTLFSDIVMYICLWPGFLLGYVADTIGAYIKAAGLLSEFIGNAIGWGLFGVVLSAIIGAIKKVSNKGMKTDQ